MNDGLKICHITTVHPYRYDIRIFKKECTYLAKAGYHVTLIVNDDYQDENNNGVRIVSLRNKPKNRIDRATRISNMAYKKAMEINANIYHIHDPELLIVALKMKKRGKIVIYDSHEFTTAQIMTKEYIPRFLRMAVSYGYSYLENRILNRLDGLIAPCLFEGRDFFSDVCIAKEIIGNLPITGSKENYIETYKYRQVDPRVCYVGAITESRGAFQMVRACALAKKRLVLIGKIENGLKDKLEIMPEYSNVEYLGELDHEEALRAVSKCAVGLCLPQYKGQYPRIDTLLTKQYEYMLLGIPQVMSDFRYFKQVLERYSFGIAVDPSDDYAIADAINYIIENKDLYDKMSKEGRRAIYTEMNWENEAKKLIGFYKRVCSRQIVKG